MLARLFRSRGVAALATLATLAMAACASAASPRSQEYAAPSRMPYLTPTSRVLDAERIRRSGAHTAWDAIRLLVPRYRLQSARISSLRMPGAPDVRRIESSIRLVIDGHQIRDLDALQAIPAQEVVAIHLLNAMEAATYFGPGSSGGAIVVQTSSSLHQRWAR